VLFGTDYPFTNVQATLAGLRGLNGMLEGTALPRLDNAAIERVIYRGSLPLLGLTGTAIVESPCRVPVAGFYSEKTSTRRADASNRRRASCRSSPGLIPTAGGPGRHSPTPAAGPERLPRHAAPVDRPDRPRYLGRRRPRRVRRVPLEPSRLLRPLPRGSGPA